MSASQQNLCVIPPQQQEPNVEQTPLITISPSEPTIGERNPFLFGNLNDNYMNSDYFNVRYNPDNFSTIQEEEKEESPPGIFLQTLFLVKTSFSHLSIQFPSVFSRSDRNKISIQIKFTRRTNNKRK